VTDKLPKRVYDIMKARALRCRRDDGLAFGLAYCATEQNKTMLCFSSWPYETGYGTCTFVNDGIKEDVDGFYCGRWRIELNGGLKGEEFFCSELISLRKYEERENVDFEKNLRYCGEVLSRAIKEEPEEFT